MAETSGQLSFAADDDGRGAMGEGTAVPGLVLVSGWLGPEACRALLAEIDAAPWSAELRRRVQHYGHRYDYGRRSMASGPQNPGATVTDAPPLPGWARELAVRLAQEGCLGRAADQVIVNEYQPGQGISPHIDCVPCFGPAVAAVTLGSGCVMDFTRPEDGARAAVRLAPGSLCLMTGPARYDWRHGIAARRSDPGPSPTALKAWEVPPGRIPRGRRVSVTFRTVPGPDGTSD